MRPSAAGTGGGGRLWRAVLRVPGHQKTKTRAACIAGAHRMGRAAAWTGTVALLRVRGSMPAQTTRPALRRVQDASSPPPSAAQAQCNCGARGLEWHERALTLTAADVRKTCDCRTRIQCRFALCESTTSQPGITGDFRTPTRVEQSRNTS